MAVSNPEFLKGMYNVTRAMGDKAVASDAMLVIEGHEQIQLLTKSFPWPTTSTQGEIEVPSPVGAGSWQPQQLRVHQQGQVSFLETTRGHIQRFLEEIVLTGGRFDAVVYEGTPERFQRAYKLRDCFVQLDPGERDWESRSQVLMLNGTIFYHYFSESIPSNVPA
jgi:hypothetical protein